MVTPEYGATREFNRLYRQYLDSGNYGTFKDRTAWAIVKDHVDRFRDSIHNEYLTEYDLETDKRRVNWYDV